MHTQIKVIGRLGNHYRQSFAVGIGQFLGADVMTLAVIVPGCIISGKTEIGMLIINGTLIPDAPP